MAVERKEDQGRPHRATRARQYHESPRARMSPLGHSYGCHRSHPIGVHECFLNCSSFFLSQDSKSYMDVTVPWILRAEGRSPLLNFYRGKWRTVSHQYHTQENSPQIEKGQPKGERIPATGPDCERPCMPLWQGRGVDFMLYKMVRSAFGK